MKWDYIIIGAGSAGCALAYELNRGQPNTAILMLEAGGSDRSPFIKFPAGQLRIVKTHDWGYRSEPDPSRKGATEPWSRGRVLGGSSSVNGTMYVRGSAQDFDRWAALCAHEGGWSAPEVMPLFREFESSDQMGALRGRTGPLYVRTVKRPHAISEAFVKSAVACGYPFNPDYNGETQEGVAFAQLSQRKGLRCSAADAFLKPLLGNKNIKLLLNAPVQRIEFGQGRAQGVSFISQGKRCREAAREIIVCAGSINSPQLLMLSGIGDPQELRRHQIELVLDRPGVGRNLKEHPCLEFTYRTKVPTYNLTEGLLQKLRIGAGFVQHREGPIANLFEGTAFLKTSRSEASPDIQLHFIPMGYSTKPDGTVKFLPYRSISVLVNKSRPLSSGRILLKSRNPDDAPVIECRLLGQQADVDTLVRGIRLVRDIMGTQPIADLIDEEIAPGADVESDAALEAYVRSHTIITYHPVGTCRMGVDTEAVVSPELRVRGIDNLWVADASIMPDLISGNTNAVCMMIGAKLGKQLAARRCVTVETH